MEGLEQFADAAAAYASLADGHSGDSLAPTARFRAGISYYRSEDTESALAAWQQAAAGYSYSTEALSSRYWLGKVLWMQGRVDEAQAGWSSWPRTAAQLLWASRSTPAR